MTNIDILKFAVDFQSYDMKIGFFRYFHEHINEMPENARDMLKVCRDQLDKEINKLDERIKIKNDCKRT